MTLQEWFSRPDAPRKAVFAREVETSPQMITQLCNGRRRPGLGLALRIAERTEGEVPPAVWLVAA